MVNIQEVNPNNGRKWTYPDLESARRPIPHSDEAPVLRWTIYQKLQKALMKLVVTLMQQCLVAVRENERAQ